MDSSCHDMKEGEILNINHKEYPLYHASFYGNKVEIAKFSKRVSCSIKHLPLRLSFAYEYDTLKAIELGIKKDPTLILNGSIFIEGLVEAEVISECFLKLLTK